MGGSNAEMSWRATQRVKESGACGQHKKLPSLKNFKLNFPGPKLEVEFKLKFNLKLRT